VYMGATARLVGLALASVMLAGCSETSFQDVFGAGKYIPDENQVHQGQVLTAPPDLQLRPPGQAPQPQPQRVAQSPQPVDTAPPPYQQSTQGNAPLYEPQKVYQPAPQRQVYQPAPQPQPVYQQPKPQQISQAPQQLQPQKLQPQAANDPYAKWGVSRYKADGTKKTQAELDEEMRKKRLAIERQKNPNYGTIFNLGSIWSDG